MQSYISYVFMTGIMSEWVMSTIEDNLETPRGPELGSSIDRIFKLFTRTEKSKYDKHSAGS